MPNALYTREQMYRNALAANAPSVDQAVQDQFGMQPGMDRLAFLPRHDPQQGWVMPNALYQAARAFVSPGAAMRGGEVSPEDAINTAGYAMTGGLGASRIAPPTGPGKTVGMAASPLSGGQVSKVRPFNMEWQQSAKPVDVLTNPGTTKSIADAFGGKRPLRWLRSKDGNIYFWDSEGFHHEGVARGLSKLGEKFQPSAKSPEYQFPMPGESGEAISGYATWGKGGFWLTDQNGKNYSLKELAGKPYGS